MPREFENVDSITDDLIVLDLLYTDRWEYQAERRLTLPHRNRGDRPPCVRVWYSEFRVRDFLVAPGVGELLLSRWEVEGKKHWGYTDNRDLSISDVGRSRVRAAYEALGVPFWDAKGYRRLRSEDWLVRHAARG